MQKSSRIPEMRHLYSWLQKYDLEFVVMTERERVILTMYLSGRSMKAIADHFGAKLGDIQYRIQKIHKKMKKVKNDPVVKHLINDAPL